MAHFYQPLNLTINHHESSPLFFLNCISQCAGNIDLLNANVILMSPWLTLR